MAIELTPRWHAGGTELDVRLVPLLRAVAKQGSLSRAVASLRLSYRHAWGLIGKTERALGQPLVAMARGRGARLTPFAENLLDADAAATTLLARELAPALQSLNRKTPAIREPAREKPLVIHASHDLALAELRDLASKPGAATVELHFRGSLECLANLARGECDLAGFHLPEATAEGTAFAPYRPLLRMRGLRLVHFVGRSQGLIVARANPKRLHSVADLARRGVRFVNRQPESGTRLLFDRLLAAAGVDPSRIEGYAVEEFTHAAVAATVASEMADAGFGIEAAARRHALDFVPVTTERYFLAARAPTLGLAAFTTLLECLRGATFRALLDRLPGYTAPDIGRVSVPRDILPSP
ncbi:MAG: helix-turn-helix transcriptional regulator [Burkholderiales bacterium]|nr:helix-turn-helix transcriptional regulator [Burkholderiales bacterium]